jgi:hypothetical protein
MDDEEADAARFLADACSKGVPLARLRKGVARTGVAMLAAIFAF